MLHCASTLELSPFQKWNPYLSWQFMAWRTWLHDDTTATVPFSSVVFLPSRNLFLPKLKTLFKPQMMMYCLLFDIIDNLAIVTPSSNIHISTYLSGSQRKGSFLLCSHQILFHTLRVLKLTTRVKNILPSFHCRGYADILCFAIHSNVDIYRNTSCIVS